VKLLTATGNWICRRCRTENTNRNGSCRVCGGSIA
jgi:ribosomal protein L40E